MLEKMNLQTKEKDGEMGEYVELEKLADNGNARNAER